MEKQQAFAALGAPIRTPEILDSNTDDEGRFYFDMDYVVGLDGHKFLEKCTPEDLRSSRVQPPCRTTDSHNRGQLPIMQKLLDLLRRLVLIS